MYTKNGASIQQENVRECSRKEKASKRGIQAEVCVGDAKKCPECENTGRVVWISGDKKTMGVQCRSSHQDVRRADTKFGATIVSSGKSRKNVVFLTRLA